MLRCAQPLPGTSGKHSTADEQLIEAAIASGPSNGHMTIYDARSFSAATGNKFMVILACSSAHNKSIYTTKLLVCVNMRRGQM